jgi:hypothetical protein
MLKDYRVMYLRSNEGHPVGCLAILVNRKGAALSYGFSVLNPADKFDRKVARQLALGRLMEAPVTVNVMREDLNMHEITRNVMKSLVINRKTPARAVKAAKLWLSTNY